MPKKICVTSVRPVGCTFIDWSIHFLSGQDHYFNVDLDQSIPLNSNPIKKINAHGHLKNHPSGSEKFIKHLKKFDSIKNHSICSTYPCTLTYDIVANHLGYTKSDFAVPDNFSTINKYILEDYNKIFEICHDYNTKLVFVAADTTVPMYYQTVRQLDRFAMSTNVPTCREDLINEFQELFFADSIKKWHQLDLNNIWDTRERMALDLRPFDLLPAENFDFQKPHLWINSQELWIQPTVVIEKIFNYLDLKINASRTAAWSTVCSQWQQIQLKMLEFDHEYQHIVDAIVNDWDYPINLTFQQEVIIQHCLIYQHNLNLKTWNLDKFPNNTRKLHKLLEPNIHKL